MKDVINMDEISVVTTPKQGPTINVKGAKQVILSGEQKTRECTSVAVTVRGNGNFMFSTFMFKRIKMESTLVRITKDFPKDNLFLAS
jgi:hypothetical protein